MLLSPVINSIGEHIEQPIIVYAQDNSESVITDSINDSEMKVGSQKIISGLSTNFKTDKYSFGEYVRAGVDFTFEDKQTNISDLLDVVQAKYYNRNIGALVVNTDGIYNTGSNPEYIASQLNFPIYTIASGSSIPKKDLLLSDVQFNKIVFLNDIYPVRITAEAKKLKGNVTKLKIYDNGKLVLQENIKINSNDFHKTIDTEIEAKKPGVHKLRIELQAVKGEFSKKNNNKEVLFEVIDNKQKILILADGPHPDIGAIKSSLEQNKNFEVDYSVAGKNSKSLSTYNLIILHQLPSERNSVVKELQTIRNNNIPTLSIIGNKSALQKFNANSSVLNIQKKANSFDPANGLYNNNFALFELNPEIKNLMKHAPPLETPFGKYSGFKKNDVLFFRKVKGIETESPLILFDTDIKQGVKSGYITGEGIWRWKIYDYKLHKNHILFNELIQKSCQFLSLKIKKDRFKVNVSKINVENKNIVFHAERYNKSYELINESDVKLQITDSAGNSFDYVFDKSRKAYEYDAGKLPPGEYSWLAQTEIDNKQRQKKGIISIREINIEANNTQANHQVLHKISELTGGKMIKISESEKLLQLLANDDRIKPVSHTEKKSFKITNHKIIFFIILLLMSTEWFIRKFSGSY